MIGELHGIDTGTEVSASGRTNEDLSPRFDAPIETSEVLESAEVCAWRVIVIWLAPSSIYETWNVLVHYKGHFKIVTPSQAYRTEIEVTQPRREEP